MNIQCNAEVLDESLVEFLSTLVQSTQDAIVCVDEGHNLVLFNPAAESMFEYSAKEILGKRVNKILPFHPNQDERTIMFGKTKGGASIPVDITNSSMVLNGHVYRASIIRKADRGDVDEIKRYRKEAKRKLLQEVGQVAGMCSASSHRPL